MFTSRPLKIVLENTICITIYKKIYDFLFLNLTPLYIFECGRKHNIVVIASILLIIMVIYTAHQSDMHNYEHHKQHMKRGEQITSISSQQWGVILVASVSFTPRLASCIHNFGKKTMLKTLPSPNI